MDRSVFGNESFFVVVNIHKTYYSLLLHTFCLKLVTFTTTFVSLWLRFKNVLLTVDTKLLSEACDFYCYLCLPRVVLLVVSLSSNKLLSRCSWKKTHVFFLLCG